AADARRSPPAVCAGGGGQDRLGNIVGPTGNNVAGVTRVPAGLVINGSARGVRAVRYALAQLGKPYVFGAAGPDAFDCSGLTMAAWAAAGVALPHYAPSQMQYGSTVPIDVSAMLPGDLIFLYPDIGHVEIYAGNGMAISAPQPGDVVK